ncbi:hypothetical protein [Knoellia sp. LjRoot47]|uniref:hypothetical protein n=1 Tax=Knoellia sp. LjRoot47 TaxID=3342330 RepID=UPI003ECE97FB
MSPRNDAIGRPGRVVELGADGFYIVEVGGGQVPAYLSDRATTASLEIGSVVTLLPMLGGFEIVSTRTGPDESGGMIFGPELLSNPGFEAGIPGEWPNQWQPAWDFRTGEPDPLDVSTDSPLSGTQVARVTSPPGIWQHNTVVLRTQAARVDAGATYRVSAFVSAKPTGATDLKVDIEVLTAATQDDAAYFNPAATFHLLAQVLAPGEAWPLLFADFVIPTGHQWCRVGLRSEAAAGSTVDVRWDSASLKQRLA